MTSLRIEVVKVKVTWKYKYSMTESFDRSSESRNDMMKLNSLAVKSEEIKQPELDKSLDYFDLKINEDNLNKLAPPSSKNDLKFVIESKNIFLGIQKWELDTTSDTEISQHDVAIGQIYSFVHPHVQISKLEINHFSIYTELFQEKHSLITSGSQDRFIEFYLWNKRKYDNSDSEDNKFLKLSEKQKVNLNIDQISFCTNKEVLKESADIVEEIIRLYKLNEEKLAEKLDKISSFSPQETPKDSEESIILKERVIRFHCEKIALILSEIPTEDDTIERMSEEFQDDTGSNTLMRESTKYDLAVSDKTSVYSSNIGFGKAAIEDSVDIVCFEVTSISLKFDLCPKNSKPDDPILSELFKLHSIPEIKGHFMIELFGYNIEERLKLKIIYQTNIMLSTCSIFEENENKHILLKILNIKCTTIEIESSINILLEIANKTSTLIEQVKNNTKDIIALLGTNKKDDTKDQGIVQQMSVSKTD